MSEQKKVVAVKLRYNPKSYWFDPVLSTYKAGDHVLVDTERGREIGLVVDGALPVTEKQLKDIKEPLKPVIRALTDTDYERIDELDAKGREAMPVFRELISKHGLDMKPVSVDYLFTGDKAVFYFSNDDRVDFRDLVRDLASRFHIRVDMRQIGVRDEARILGGLAHCGEELCCTRLGGEFQPVSIRMAKEQDLPLNPTKISGACGRLMCCLRYEFEAYKDFKSRAPKKGAIIETPIGQGKVIDFDTPREIITLRLEDGKQLSVPLKDFECDKDADGKCHPCRISRDTIDRCASSSILMALAALDQETAPVEPVERVERRRRKNDREPDARRPRRGSKRGSESDTGEETRVETRGDRQKRRQESGKGDKKVRDKKEADAATPRKRNAQKNKPRPGQHSSGLRGSANDGGAEDTGKPRDAKKALDTKVPGEERSGSGNRRNRGNRRRRGGSSGGGGNDVGSGAGGNNNESRSGANPEGLRRRRRPTNKPESRSE